MDEISEARLRSPSMPTPNFRVYRPISMSQNCSSVCRCREDDPGAYRRFHDTGRKSPAGVTGLRICPKSSIRRGGAGCRRSAGYRHRSVPAPISSGRPGVNGHRDMAVNGRVFGAMEKSESGRASSTARNERFAPPAVRSGAGRVGNTRGGASTSSLQPYRQRRAAACLITGSRRVTGSEHSPDPARRRAVAGILARPPHRHARAFVAVGRDDHPFAGTGPAAAAGVLAVGIGGSRRSAASELQDAGVRHGGDDAHTTSEPGGVNPSSASIPRRQLRANHRFRHAAKVGWPAGNSGSHHRAWTNFWPTLVNMRVTGRWNWRSRRCYVYRTDAVRVTPRRR